MTFLPAANTGIDRAPSMTRTRALTHLERLEGEAIHIIREVVAECEQPGHALFDRQGQLRHAAPRAEGVLSGEAAVPVPARRHDLEVPRDDRVPGRAGEAPGPRSARPHQSRRASQLRHQPVHARLGRAHRRDEDAGAQAGARQVRLRRARSAAPAATRRSRAPRSASSRSARRSTAGIPKQQRPELWRLYNTRKRQGESIRVFPLSNWTELDVWHYIYLENIPIVPLYFAKPRPVVRARRRAGSWSTTTACRSSPARSAEMRTVRFRTLGCYPLTGAIDSERRHAAGDHPGDAAHDAAPSGRDA